MRGNRLRWGALGWVLTLQFFVVETIAQVAQSAPYSRLDDVISDLGATTSPAGSLMNASFVVQGALILVGVLLLLPALRTAAARVAQVLLAVSAIGVVLVGVVPENGHTPVLHTIGAVAHLGAGTVGIVALAYAVRQRSEWLGTLLAALGVIGIAASLFFLDAVTEYLGRGGTERLAAYPIPIALAVTAVVLWRMSDATGALPDTATGPSRRELREQARAERDERQRARDAALEAAVAGRSGSEAGSTADAGDDDGLDPEDPWAPRRRR